MSTLLPRTVRISTLIDNNLGITTQELADEIGRQEGGFTVPTASIRRDIQTIRKENPKVLRYRGGWGLADSQKFTEQGRSTLDPCHSYGDTREVMDSDL